MDRGIYDYETNKYTRQNESKTQNKKIQETDEKRQTDSLIYDTQELDNSSFSLDKNANVYKDLLKTNNIEYFKKDNSEFIFNK